MATFERSITSPRSAEEALAFLSDLANAPLWDSSIRTVAAAGANQWDVVHGFYGKAIDVRYVRADADSHHVRFVGKGSKLHVVTEFRVDSLPHGSAITYLTTVKLRGALAVLGKGMNAAIEGIGKRSLTNLERELESQLAI